MVDGPGDLPEAAARRLETGSFSSALTAPDFAACLQMGLRPVGLVQGFCVMQWGWNAGAGALGMGGGLGGGMGMGGAFGAGSYGVRTDGYSETWRCPHGFVSNEHRQWGQNFEQTWVEAAWAEGFGSAYRRLLEEAQEAGAHGIIGVVDSARHLGDLGVVEFHLLGTAVVVDGGPPPPGGQPWTTYLAGQRLAKLFEAGFMPLSVSAAMASVRVWASCVTGYLMESSGGMWGGQAGVQEVDQISRARMAVYGLARDQVRRQLGQDTLQGATVSSSKREMAEGDQIVECTLRGSRVRRFKDFEALPAPQPTVCLS